MSPRKPPKPASPAMLEYASSLMRKHAYALREEFAMERLSFKQVGAIIDFLKKGVAHTVAASLLVKIDDASRESAPSEPANPEETAPSPDEQLNAVLNHLRTVGTRVASKKERTENYIQIVESLMIHYGYQYQSGIKRENINNRIAGDILGHIKGNSAYQYVLEKFIEPKPDLLTPWVESLRERLRTVRLYGDKNIAKNVLQSVFKNQGAQIVPLRLPPDEKGKRRSVDIGVSYDKYTIAIQVDETRITPTSLQKLRGVDADLKWIILLDGKSPDKIPDGIADVLVFD